MVDSVFIGDDFTGASDTLATLAEAGYRTRLFLQAPDPDTVATLDLDAVGIATDLRAQPPAEIDARLRALGPALADLSPRVLHYKVCSTFDSAPDVGSIGAAVLALEQGLKPSLTAVIGGQPSLGRFCVFGNLFARAPDGVVYRIDRHPIMSRHPTTPMGEADLRIHLAAQGLADLMLVPRGEEHATVEHLDARQQTSPARLLFDAVGGKDIARIGSVLRALETNDQPLLIIGSSSVAEALAAGRAKPLTDPTNGKLPPVSGPRLILAGSRSSATAAQIAAAFGYERVPLRRSDLTAEGLPACAQQCAAKLAGGTNVLVHLLAERDYGLSPNALSERLADLAVAITRQHPVRALGVAGGDTSSAVVHRLGFESLSFERRAGSGVAICRGHAPSSSLDGTRLLLKGGQVGPVDLFDRFLT